ncbi:MAG: radical SAM protein [Candidatus Blackburnbacteria bacterium]|nr:radical SAM protein [Candidatus Blackburnbacteria bacterium]
MKEGTGISLILGERGASEHLTSLNVPRSVDVSLTGRCQLRCAWCWGPKHNLKEPVVETQWRDLIIKLSTDGSEHIIFTGGEPLMSPMLPSMLRHAKEAGLRTTLSTNAILLRQRQEVLQDVDDLGISIDGSGPTMNDMMRERSARYDAWGKAVDGINFAQSLGVPVTARTVISRKNLHDVPNIPGALVTRGVDISKLRHKLYQVEPIGPHATNIKFDDWAVTEEEATSAALAVKERHPELGVTLQLYRNTRGRYFQIDPLGNAYGTDLDMDQLPMMVHYGNIFTDYDGCINNYQEYKRSLEE